MTNLLIKLKLKGKTVGYLKIRDGFVWYRTDGIWRRYTGHEIEFDTAHLFVCKDKNKKDVFDGDKIKGTIRDCDSPVQGTIFWNKDALCWGMMVEYKTMKTPYCLFSVTDIELIED